MSLIGLASAIIEGPFGRTQEMVLTGLNEMGDIIVPRSPFQFWPESISISMSADYADKPILGGSHPIKQWVSTSGRQISFSLLVARDIKPKTELPEIAFLVAPQADTNKEFNYDIKREIDRLQACLLPTYKDGDEPIIVRPPPIVYIEAPGLGWALNAEPDILVGVITSLNIVYKRVFTESGTPRQATIDVSVSEVVQYPGEGVRFFGLEDLASRDWWNVSDPS